MTNKFSFQDVPPSFVKVSFIEPYSSTDSTTTHLNNTQNNPAPNLYVNEEVLETKSRHVPEIVVEEQEYLRTRRKSLDDGLILSLRGHRQSSGDSGIDRLTGVGFKPDAIRRLTGSLVEGSNSFSSLPTVEKRKNNGRQRNQTAKSLPETPRMSLDLGVFLNGSNSLSGIGRRRNTTASMFHDNGSIFDDDATPEEEKRKHLRKNLTMIYSGIYAVMVVVMGGVLYVASQSQVLQIPGHYSEIFNMVIIVLGMFWLMFLHIDLNRYKRFVLDSIRRQHENMADNISTTTETVFNQSWLPENTKPSYFFLRGRHSGSFYLKAGMAAFCFGHLINCGLLLSQQVLYFTEDDKADCRHVATIVLYVVRPIYSFYQLFMVFKYSNIIINRNKGIARFGLMHCIATCLCFWFNTIVEEAIIHLQHQESWTNRTEIGVDFNTTMERRERTAFECANGTIFSSQKMEAIPYLYPFTIEYNLLLVGIWLIIWQNIGRHVGAKADPHHFEHKVSHHDENEETYQSNLVISADCHSANKGLFAGLFLLMITMITLIVFFVTLNHEDSGDTVVQMYSFQEITLSVLALLGILYSFRQLTKMDINIHPVTFLDDVLLFIPLPFFFANNILSSLAELHYGNYLRVVVHVLCLLQVIIQTPFIIDGLRRCSNAKNLRYKKPGREVITFLIILNLSTWIVNTFEHKNVEKYLSNHKYFGETIAAFIGHTTHPLMLFYRFHSSVCMSDIWKSAYEKGDH